MHHDIVEELECISEITNRSQISWQLLMLPCRIMQEIHRLDEAYKHNSWSRRWLLYILAAPSFQTVLNLAYVHGKTWCKMRKLSIIAIMLGFSINLFRLPRVLNCHLLLCVKYLCYLLMLPCRFVVQDILMLERAYHIKVAARHQVQVRM